MPEALKKMGDSVFLVLLKIQILAMVEHGGSTCWLCNAAINERIHLYLFCVRLKIITEE